jgi:hypothetical protein
MERATRLYAGTRKGLFRLCSHDGRRTWMTEPPHLAGWSVYHATEDPRAPGRIYAAARSEHWGPMLARSEDDGRTWNERGPSPAFPEGSGKSVNAVWYVRPGHAERPGEVWVGVDPAALFRSRDWGESWELVPSLTDHETTRVWMAGGGGLILHGVDIDPTNPESMIVTVSAGGSYRTDDGAATWRPINRGIRADFMTESDRATGAGHCVHHLVRSPVDPEWLFQQNHCGVYRSADGGESWDDVAAGLPSSFGFAAATHPHEAKTVYVCPLGSDSERTVPGGALTVWRSRDGGDSWEPLTDGLPQRNAYVMSFRLAMTTDREDPAGIYLGTSTGQIFFSPDAGDRWELVADFLPPILSLETA